MNYSTDVKFSNNLIKNGKTTITYSGSLFRTGSESVTLVYGFGDNWEHTTEKEMTKNENNFSVEIELLDYNKINFCFRNSNNIWDNNNYLNYIAPIAEPEKEYNFIINENLMPGILDNLLEIDLSKVETEKFSQIENEIIAFENQEKETPIELVETAVVSEEPFEIIIPEDDSVDISQFLGEVTDEPSLLKDLECAFSNIDESADIKKENIVNFDMDSLIDEILSPILEAKSAEVPEYKVSMNIEELDVDPDFLKDNVQSVSSDAQVTETIEEIPTVIDESADTQDFENDANTVLENINSENSLIEVKEFGNSFIVSPRSLNKFYILRKRIKLAVYKFFTAIPKIIESAFNEEKN